MKHDTKDDDSWRAGGCLCGAVRFRAKLNGPHYHACHCRRCRQWGGSPAMASPASKVEVEDDTALAVYSSSRHGERCFCRDCGTHLFWRLKAGGVFAVWVGALDDSEDMSFESQIYIDAKPESYAFANETTNVTSEQMRALFTARPG